MYTFLIYELKVAVALAVFSLFFRVLLSKETFHRFNRVLLLGTTALAFILPFCIIVSHETMTMTSGEFIAQTPEVLPLTPGKAFEVADYLTLAAAVVFFIGAMAVFARTIISIIKIMKLAAKGRRIPQDDGTVLVVVEDKKYSPFSWMKYIVMSEEDHSSTGEGILIHEKAHIALGHSWDILFMELVTAMQWFNPAAWILKADLTALHEYEADEAVINAGTDMREYQLMLVRKAVVAVRYPAANNLNHSTLKNRITMMLCKKSSFCGALKALYVLPLIAVSLAVNAETRYDYVIDDPKPEAAREMPAAVRDTVRTASPAEQEEAVPFQFLEVKPGFNGGDANEFSKWVNTQLRYPEEAHKNNIQGRVTLQFTVEKDGSVTGVKVLRGVNPLLDAEAIRVVSSSPNWTPGYQEGKPVRVTYVFPAIFQLKDNGKEADQGNAQ